MTDALETWRRDGSAWQDDSTPILDRAFYIRYPSGSDDPELPQSREAAEGLVESERTGRWLVVAGHPFAAFNHSRHTVHPSELKCGWCGSCQATSFDIHCSLVAALRVDANPALYS